MTPDQFNRLPKWKQRVLIAKDVHKQLIMGFYVGDHTYVDLYFKDYMEEREKNKSMKDALNSNKVIEKCEVCARGSLFLSSIKFKNELTIAQTENSEWHYDTCSGKTNGTDFLNLIFPRKMQSLLESAFETSRYGDSGDSDAKAAIAYGIYLEKESKRSLRLKLNRGWNVEGIILYWLMANIIKNKGEFIVPKKFL